MSSPADRFLLAGGASAGADDHLLLHHHQMYHVPQHSRREKLRFPADRSSSPPPPLPPPPPTSLLLLHDQNFADAAATTLYASSSLPTMLQPPHPLNFGSYSTYGVLPTAIPADENHSRIPGQGFNLSLSSASSSSSSSFNPASASASAHRQQFWNRLTPLGPFTGYAAVLSRSRFLEPARRLLEEVCDVGQQRASASDSRGGDMMLDGDDPGEDQRMDDIGARKDGPGMSNSEQQWRRTRLISMLDEVYKRYKQYYQQVQAVISSFESVAGLSSAAPYAFLVLKAMTKHFRCVKNIIVAQLRQTNKVLGKEGLCRDEISGLGLLDGNCLQRVASNTGNYSQPHVWRPQRGLPERAVAVLRAWLFEHFLHPYPTDTDKQMLAKQTGLTRNQVSNWFINARVRLWKPMVEEIHSLEMKQKNKTLPAENDRNTSEQADLLTSSNGTLFNYQQPEITTIAKDPCSMTKSIHKEFGQIPNGIQESVTYEYDSFPNHQHHHVGSELGFSTGGNSGVSLTLGLQQNNGICFPEQLPLNVARRFGLEDCSDTYMVNSFTGQDRQFGKDVGSRLLHDFVG